MPENQPAKKNPTPAPAPKPVPAAKPAPAPAPLVAPAPKKKVVPEAPPITAPTPQPAPKPAPAPAAPHVPPAPPVSAAGTVRIVDAAPNKMGRVLMILVSLVALTLFVLMIVFWSRSNAGQDQVDDLQETVSTLQTRVADYQQEALEALESEEEEGVLIDELSEILVHTFDGPGAGYAGVAELEGYVVDVDMVTTLDGSGEPASCKAFYVTDGPWEAMAFLDVRSSHYGGDPLIILGESGAAIESAWFNTRDINDSSEGDSVKAIFRLGSRFEGELVGCMKDTEFIGTSDLSKGFIGG